MTGRSLTLPRAILLAALPLLGWWLTGLFDLDEGFYGAVAAEMNRRHEWITPYYNGVPWFEKPILLYWLSKITIGLFGFDVGPRLPSVLCSIATIALVGVWGERRLQPGTGKLAALVLGSSLLPVALGRMMMTDPPLVLCLTVAFLGYWEAMRRPWLLPIVGVALGTGVLAKGPVALLLFFPPMVYLAVRTRRLPGGIVSWLVALTVLAATIASWYLPAYRANGQEFVQKFLIEQNLGRFGGGDEAHSLGFVALPFFIPVVLLGMMPWSAWLWRAWRERGDEDHRRGYLWAWAATVFIFFSLGGAKLVHYVLPLFPPLALLVADRLVDRKWASKLAVGMAVFMFLFANAGFLVWYRLSGQEEAQRLVRRAGVRQAPAVVLYQLGRRESSRGTGGTQLKETSLPSLIMYLDRVAPFVEEPRTLKVLPPGTVIFTRTGRIENPKNNGLETLEQGENFALYRKSGS